MVRSNFLSPPLPPSCLSFGVDGGTGWYLRDADVACLLGDGCSESKDGLLQVLAVPETFNCRARSARD